RSGLSLFALLLPFLVDRGGDISGNIPAKDEIGLGEGEISLADQEGLAGNRNQVVPVVRVELGVDRPVLTPAAGRYFLEPVLVLHRQQCRVEMLGPFAALPGT